MYVSDMFGLFIHPGITTQNQAAGFALVFNSKTCKYYNLLPVKSTPPYCWHKFFLSFFTKLLHSVQCLILSRLYGIEVV